MAVDTIGKRRSVVNVGTPFRVALPEPDGTISAADRLHLGYLYSGIAVGAAAVVVSLTDIRDALVDRLETISGLRVYSSQMDALNEFPCAVVIFDRLDYVVTAGGYSFEWQARIVVMVDSAITQDAFTQLDDYMDSSSATSIENAIYGDATLGGDTDWLVVRSLGNVRRVPETTLVAADVMVSGIKQVLT